LEFFSLLVALGKAGSQMIDNSGLDLNCSTGARVFCSNDYRSCPIHFPAWAHPALFNSKRLLAMVRSTIRRREALELIGIFSVIFFIASQVQQELSAIQEPHSFHKMHHFVPINMHDWTNGFGFQIWESLLGKSEQYIGNVLDALFPTTHLPSGNSRRSFLYDRPSPRLDGFSSTSDILERSAEVQRRIFEHQNPPTCEGRSFARIEKPWCFGLGSFIHVTSIYLAGAMDRNEILIYADKFLCQGTQEPECVHSPNLNCFFLPLSNCTPQNRSRIRSIWVHHLSRFNDVPRFIPEILNDSAVDPLAYARYWTDHSMAYLTRLNSRMEGWIEQRMRDTGVLSTWQTTGFDVGIHIRHGDKGLEMPLINDNHYMEVVKLLRKIEHRNLTVFLASGDDSSIKFFQNQTGIQLYVIPKTAPGQYLNTVYYLSNLWALTRSKYVVGTYSSNVDRWLRALMNVAANHSSSIFFEVGYRPCFSARHCRKTQIEFPSCAELEMGSPKMRALRW
jgi:hypothetical protein